jgi:hypothetical protein
MARLRWGWFLAALTTVSSDNPDLLPGLRHRILSFATTRRGPPAPVHDRGQVGLPAEMEGTTPADEFVPAGLAALGIEADEIDLAVMGAVHHLLWMPVRELLYLDLEGLVPERCPDLSKAPE